MWLLVSGLSVAVVAIAVLPASKLTYLASEFVSSSVVVHPVFEVSLLHSEVAFLGLEVSPATGLLGSASTFVFSTFAVLLASEVSLLVSEVSPSRGSLVSAGTLVSSAVAVFPFSEGSLLIFKVSAATHSLAAAGTLVFSSFVVLPVFEVSRLCSEVSPVGTFVASLFVRPPSVVVFTLLGSEVLSAPRLLALAGSFVSVAMLLLMDSGGQSAPGSVSLAVSFVSTGTHRLVASFFSACLLGITVMLPLLGSLVFVVSLASAESSFTLLLSEHVPLVAILWSVCPSVCSVPVLRISSSNLPNPTESGIVC